MQFQDNLEDKIDFYNGKISQIEMNKSFSVWSL